MWTKTTSDLSGELIDAKWQGEGCSRSTSGNVPYGNPWSARIIPNSHAESIFMRHAFVRFMICVVSRGSGGGWMEDSRSVPPWFEFWSLPEQSLISDLWCLRNGLVFARGTVSKLPCPRSWLYCLFGLSGLPVISPSVAFGFVRTLFLSVLRFGSSELTWIVLVPLQNYFLLISNHDEL